MSSSYFTIKDHTVPASHIRQYPRGARSPAAGLNLRLAVKQYIPKTSSPPLPDAITILTANALGFPKETYEPLWDLLIQRLPPGSIRSIWTADTVHQGASAILNDGLLGDDPHWWDHSRDLLALVNHFSQEMPQPIVGVAHSMGCAMLLRLSIMHPQLMCGLALIEPVVQDEPPLARPNNALGSSLREDWWPNREAAEASFRDKRNKFYCRFDPQVLDRYLAHAFRNLPTPVYPDPSKGGLTLATSKAQEAWSFARGNFSAVGDEASERLRSPELDYDHRLHLFHRAEMTMMNRDLPLVAPRVLYVFAEKSYINLPATREDKVMRTGAGIGGNGSVATGGTEAVTVKGGMHLLPMEEPQKVAKLLAPWLQKMGAKFAEEERWRWEDDRGISDKNMTVMSQKWFENVKKRENTLREMPKATPSETTWKDDPDFSFLRGRL